MYYPIKKKKKIQTNDIIFGNNIMYGKKIKENHI